MSKSKLDKQIEREYILSDELFTNLSWTRRTTVGGWITGKWRLLAFLDLRCITGLLLTNNTPLSAHYLFSLQLQMQIEKQKILTGKNGGVSIETGPLQFSPLPRLEFGRLFNVFFELSWILLHKWPISFMLTQNPIHPKPFLG